MAAQYLFEILIELIKAGCSSRGLASAAVIALVISGTGGCRMSTPEIEPFARPLPPVIMIPESASQEIRAAAAELSSRLEAAYGFRMEPRSVSAEQRQTRISAGDGFFFMVGFQPDGKEIAFSGQNSERDREFHYFVDQHGVYFYRTGSGVAEVDADGGRFAAPALDLAVYRFLESEMGFRWLTPNEQGFAFPDSPRRLRSGSRGTVQPVFCLLMNWTGAEAEADCSTVAARFTRGAEENRLIEAEYASWLRRFAVIVEKPGKRTTAVTAGPPFFFPGQEEDYFRTFSCGDKQFSGPAVSYFDWGLVDFARYGLAATKAAGGAVSYSSLLDDFTASMGEAAEPVRRYFQYWRDAFAVYNGDAGQPGKAMVPADRLFSRRRLRESGAILLQAQAVSDLSASAAFRIESLRLGHEHMSLSHDVRHSLAEAEDEKGFIEAGKKAEVLTQVREQLRSLTSVDLAGLTRRELAAGDLAGMAFFQAADALIPQAKLGQWRYKVDYQELGKSEEWFAEPPETITGEWTLYESDPPVLFGSAVTWFASVLESAEAWEGTSRLLIWGKVPGSEVFVNGVKLEACEDILPQGSGSGAFTVNHEILGRGRTMTVVMRLPATAYFAPCRDAWLLSEP